MAQSGAEEGEGPVAAATYRKHGERQLMEIELLAVRGSAQRRGYGALLMRGLVRCAAAEGLGAMVTSADETAVGYFAACGFRPSRRDQARAAPRATPDDTPRGRAAAGKQRCRFCIKICKHHRSHIARGSIGIKAIGVGE